MIATSIIAALMAALMLWGRIPDACLAVLCAAIPIAAACASRHGRRHRHDLMGVDVLAHGSRLAAWSAGLKTCLCVALVALCVALDSLLVAAVLLVGMSAVTLWSSRVGLARYCALMAVPILFVSLSGIVLLVDVSPDPGVGLDVAVLGWHLVVTPGSQARTLLVVAKAVGSLACLYALALSTPVYEIAGFLQRVRVPSVVVDLMVLVYRYISILLESLRRMTTAAEARLGDGSLRASWRSFTGVASNLFVRSFFRASRSFDAMEARCCADDLRFDVRERPLALAQAWGAVGCLAAVCAAYACERMLL